MVDVLHVPTITKNLVFVDQMGSNGGSRYSSQLQQTWLFLDDFQLGFRLIGKRKKSWKNVYI